MSKMKKTTLVLVSFLALILLTGVHWSVTTYFSLDPLGVPYVKMTPTFEPREKDTENDNYVQGIGSFVMPHLLEGKDREKNFYEFLNLINDWQTEVENTLGTPRYVNFYLNNENGETVATYTGYYTDENGTRQTIEESRSYPYILYGDYTEFNSPNIY